MRERMNMSKNLWESSFNKFIKSKIIEIYEEEEAKNKIISEAEKAERHLSRNESIIFRIIFYNSENFECRFWLFQDMGFAACPRRINRLLQYRNVYIEILGATSLVATFDIETARSLGNEISVIPGGPKGFGGYIRSMLESAASGESRTETTKETRLRKFEAEAKPTTVVEVDIDATRIFESCVDLVGKACGGVCPGNAEELLDMVGVLAFGKEDEYICILRREGDCEFIYIEITDRGEKVEKGCIDRDMALEIVRQRLDTGWELVDLSHLSRRR